MSDATHVPERLFEEFPPIPSEAWLAEIEKDLKGADFDKKLVWRSPERIRVKPFFRKEDVSALKPLWGGQPGQEPFARGAEPGRLGWTIRQDVCAQDPAEANRQAKDALLRGAESVAFVTRPKAGGCTGVYVHTASDLATALEGIDPTAAPVDWESGCLAEHVAVWYASEVERRGCDPAQVRGTIGYDPIADLALGTRGFKGLDDFRRDLNAHLALMRRMPKVKALEVHSGWILESGGTTAQELAFALASGAEYLAAAEDPEAAARSVRLEVAIGPNFFFEVAKLRALRALWDRMVAAFGLSEEARKPTLHARTCLWNKTVFDPYVNLLRATTETLAAAIGGADSISVTPFDLPYESPSDFAQRLARNTQILAREEARLGKVQDPAGGSYYVEWLTYQLAQHGWRLFQEIEGEGGCLKALEAGTIQKRVAEARAEKDQQVAQRRIVLVGTNNYPNLKETMLEQVSQPEPKPAPLPDVPAAPAFEPLRPYRAAEPFEEVRLGVERAVRDGAKRPVVYLLTIGNLAMRKARANFVLNLLGCAGFQILEGPGATDVEEGVRDAAQAGADAIVLCSSDEEYATFGPQAAAAVSKLQPRPLLVLAGYPQDLVEGLREAGFDEFVHVRSNALETLRQFRRRLLPSNEDKRGEDR
ncbi:MAG: methylmalonyl-CoA mutase subunit beta [Fimbriimonadales bacterium]|nr:methylmalonyl-CoA mutase subunit beta [Fimbriimonadales bacterium]